MRFWLSGPRILGIRPGITFRPDELFVKQKPAKRSQGGFIYVIRSADSNLVKIGVSANPSTRLAQLQTGSPARLSFAYIAGLRCDGFAIETCAQEIVRAYHCEGGDDWFSCGADMAVAAISTAAYRLGEPIASIDPKIVSTVVAAVATDDHVPRKSHFVLWFFIGVAALWTILMYAFVL